MKKKNEKFKKIKLFSVVFISIILVGIITIQYFDKNIDTSHLISDKVVFTYGSPESVEFSNESVEKLNDTIRFLLEKQKKISSNIRETIFDLNKENILYVGGSGPGNYTSIQSAIDAANSYDMIFVYSGTYYENIEIRKSIKLEGHDKFSTIIDGGEEPNLMYINSDEVIITGFTFQNSEIGIIIEFSSNNIIIENVIENMDVGVWLYDSNNNHIINNSISGNAFGIELLSTSEDNRITTNSIESNLFGIGFYNSSNNIIKNNEINENSEDGIWLNYGSNNNEIKYNNIENNKFGIDVISSLKNKISGNNLTNQDIGVLLDENCIKNVIIKNNFFENDNNAWDNGNNIWNDSSVEIGNYWSDYKEKYPDVVDNNYDGIWDSPYLISSDSINNIKYDQFPSVNPISYQIYFKPILNCLQGHTCTPGEICEFTFNTIHPLNLQVRYYIDWGDGNFYDSKTFYNSGETSDIEQHIYNEKGNYIVRVKAIDETGMESEWSDPWEMSVPKNKSINEFKLLINRINDGIFKNQLIIIVFVSLLLGGYNVSN
jgi:parallel beta-helix repeat protein